MQINVFDIKDDLGGNWWHHIYDSNFGFLSKINDLGNHKVIEDVILIHKKLKKANDFQQFVTIESNPL